MLSLNPCMKRNERDGSLSSNLTDGKGQMTDGGWKDEGARVDADRVQIRPEQVKDDVKSIMASDS